jgi:hypothetical protein
MRPVRLAYQPLAGSTFLSKQISHQLAIHFSQNKSASATSQTNMLMDMWFASVVGDSTRIIAFDTILFSWTLRDKYYCLLAKLPPCKNKKTTPKSGQINKKHDCSSIYSSYTILTAWRMRTQQYNNMFLETNFELGNNLYFLSTKAWGAYVNIP